MTSATARRFFGAMAGAVGALGLGLAATPANAVVFTLQQPCNLYGAGCVFTFTDNQGNDFDNIGLIVDTYNAAVDPNIGPLNFIVKVEMNPAGGDESNEWTFENLTYDPAVSFYLIKTAADSVLLKGFLTPMSSFDAVNDLILNQNDIPRNISHVNLYSIDGRGTPNESPAPEPGAWALLIMGFGAAGAVLRRRRTTVFG